MDDKELDLQAEETLAITNPEAYAISNPTPRDWTMTAQEIARSIKINPIEALTTKAQREGPEKYNWLETVVRGTFVDPFVEGVRDIDEAINVRNMEFSSPDMTPDEAERLMQDALYTRHFLRQTRQADTAEKIKYKKWYDFSNAVGSAIKYAGLGFVTGSPMAIGAVAGIEAGAQMEADLVDRYIEKTGDIEGYTKDERLKDLGIAGAYGVFNGITETMLGVERLATGALGRYSTLEAMARLARSQGKIGKSIALKALRRAGMSAIEEGGEEFIQSIGEDLANAIAGYGEDLGSMEGFKKALTSAIYGAIIGGTMGWGLYRYNRKSIVDKINKWNTKNGAGLDEGQMAEVADQIIEDGKTQMLDEIATRVEIKNQYGQAYDKIKQRIKETIEATGTTPWTDPNKTLDEFVEENAKAIANPTIFAENVWGIPMSEFIDVANLVQIPGQPFLMFAPITNIDDAKALLEEQKQIVKEQTDAKKLGVEKEGLKEAAQRRIAMLNIIIRNMEREQGLQIARRTSKKAQADYITAKDLKPESTGTIETATQAEEGQEYVMFAGQRIPVEYQVVELADIQPSHIDGEPNPNYTNTELQNRASRGTVQDVADLRERATNITPERLLRAPTSAEGAPVVNELGEVIAGNGRAEIIRYAYQNPESAEKYRQALTKAGFDTTGMTQPVLVRRNTTMTPQEQVAAAELSNISETSAFDEASQAKRDSQYLKDSATPTDFAAKIPMSERRGLMQNNGKWNKRAVNQRYEDALLSWLTGNDTQLFETLVLDGTISQKVMDVLTTNGALIHELATKYPDLNLREDIYHALQKMQIATKDNFVELTQQIELDGRDVMPENILIWNWLYADTTTNRQFLNNYATILRQNRESMDNGQDMFGDKVAPLSKKDALMQALKKTDEARAQVAAERGREYEGLFAQDTGEVTNAELAAAIASYQNQFAPVAQVQNQILNKQQFDLADQNVRLDDIYPEYTGETIEVDGKERTVYNSKGERIAKSAEALTNFWNWFGDSKAVDEQGRPLVLYHGSPFSTIKEFIIPEDPERPRGIFFTDNEEVAETFTFYGNNATVYPVYLKIDDPQMFDEQGENWDDFLEWKWFENIPENKDGIIVKNIVEAPAHQSEIATDYIVFDNKQIKSTQNSGKFGPTANIYNKLAYISGTTFYERPSTKYVLKGGEGQIIHGWGIYALADKNINKRRYREGQFAGKYVYVPNMPKTTQLIKGAKTDKESQIFKMVLDTIAGRTPINMYKPIGFAGGISSYVPIFYLDAIYEVMGDNANKADKAFLEEVIKKGQFADETIFKIDPKMSQWLQRAIIETLDMHNDLKNSEFYKKDFPYIFINTLTLKEVQNDFLDFIKKNFKHKDLSATANKALSKAIVTYVQNGGRIEYEPFDNRIFAESGAQVIDMKEMETEAQTIIEKLRDTLYGGYREMASIDEVVKTQPEVYGGYLGLAVIASKVPFTATTDLFYRINNGTTTLSNIKDDPDYKYIKEKAQEKGKLAAPTINKYFTSILDSAKKIYDSEEFNKDYPYQSEEAKTWAAISQAVQNMTQEQIDMLGLYLFTAYNIPESQLDLFAQIIQHPENVKKTRGQQLEIDVPEEDVLLNEDLTLEKQPSAKKLREIITDWQWDFAEELVSNIRTKSWIKNHGATDWALYASKHGIEDPRGKNALDKFVDRLREEHMKSWDRDTISKERQLLIDYIMQNMFGGGLYRAFADILPNTYLELESGEEIGEVKDYEGKAFTVMDEAMPAELARDIALYLNEQGIKGIKYRGGIDEDGFVIFSDEAIQTLERLDDELPIYYKKGARLQGQYDADLQTLLLTKYWDETTLVHEFHHRYLEIIWGKFKQAQAGTFQANAAFTEDTKKLFDMLGIDPNQDKLTTVQQERFATMVEAYVTGLGVDDQENLAFQGFLHWVPEKYRSIMDLGYLDEQGRIQNPMLDQQSIDFFNRWFASPLVPSLPSAPDAQRLVNVSDDQDEIVPSTQKVMNDREKEWGQDSEIQNKADAQLWRAIGENNPSDLRAALDGQEEINKAELKATEDDRILPEKPKLRDRWFKARIPDARETAAEAARAYVVKNPEHARELAFADPETMAEYDAPVDQGMLIRAVMETVDKGSDEWYILDNNLAMVKSMSGSTLALSGDTSHQAYLDAKREVEAARELKAAVNYAGTRFGAMDKWNMDIRAFAAKRTAAIMATAPGSKEREVAIKAFLEEAKTKFSGNTTNAIYNKLDLTGYNTRNSQVFVKWAEKQIRNAAHAQLDTKEQAELMKASVKAQLALRDIDSRELKGDQYVRAVAAAKDIRHWQFVKDKMKKAYIGRWGRFGIFMDNLFGSYAPSAMLMSVNTLFFANVPSTALNNAIVGRAARLIGDNKVDSRATKGEVQRIKQIFNASGMNLAQMEKPTSPSLMHGEKYTNQEQTHWYNFTFDILGKEDNWFRIPTFVDALARIATRDAKGDPNKATMLFKQYAQLNDQTDEAKIARKEALAVANMAVFTQDGTMASALNHIRSNLNTLSRGLLGLDPNGFGLGNILAPFLKTGANVIEMGTTATLAPVRTAAKGLKVLRGKELTDLEKIALTTDWVYLALAAASTALLAAISGPDDDWYEEPYQPGRKYDPNKPYDSIRLGNTWIKLDIFGPLEVPLRTAAMLVKNWEDKKLSAVGNGLYEAMGEIPLVNQVTDSSMDYMSKYPGKWGSSFLYNQVNKLMPAQVKTLTRAGSRATGTTVDVSALGPTIERKFHRNYGLDGERLTTNDLINILTNRLKYTPK